MTFEKQLPYLPLSEGQIRLLAVLPNASQHELLQCELHVFALEYSPPFEALSYTWAESDAIRNIWLDDVQFSVAENLDALLRNHGLRGKDRYFWLDYVCINQNDAEERKKILSKMGDIHARADKLIIYLGRATNATDQLMDYLIQNENEEMKMPPELTTTTEVVNEHNIRRRGYRDLLFRFQFQRVWIYRDIADFKIAIVHCGSKAASSKTFVRASHLFLLEQNRLSLQPVLDLLSGYRVNDPLPSALDIENHLERPDSPASSERSSATSAPSTNTSYPPDYMEVSVWHAVEIMLTDETFAMLCLRGFCQEGQDPAKFANILRRELRCFGDELRREKKSYSIQLTARLICKDCRRMASVFRAQFDPSYKYIDSKLFNAGLASMTEAERRSRINSFIQQLDSSSNEASKQTLNTIDEENSDTEDEADNALHGNVSEFSLNEIEEFLPSSQAFKTLVDSLRAKIKFSESPKATQLVSPLGFPQFPSTAPVATLADTKDPPLQLQEITREMSPLALPELEIPALSLGSRLYESLSNWLSRIERPEVGLHRVQYICSCRELMYLDVNELKPGGIENFRQRLAKNLSGPQRQVPASLDEIQTSPPTVPQRAYLIGSSAVPIRDPPPIPDQVGIEDSAENLLVESALESDTDTPRYLLLCINTRNLTDLLHIDLTDVTNDQCLFKSIRRRYWAARRRNSLHYGMLTPQWLMDRIPGTWENWLGTLHLRVPQSADFIKFQLVPFPKKLCPNTIRLELPPEDQVKVRQNYHYDPCPPDVEILRIHKFSHLLKPGTHTYDFWWKTFPKKLREELEYKPAVIGWGLKIREGWDWVIILSSMLVLMVLVGVAVVLYAIFAHDQASAFGLGAYAVAVIMLLLSVKYWAWQEHEDS